MGCCPVAVVIMHVHKYDVMKPKSTHVTSEKLRMWDPIKHPPPKKKKNYSSILRGHRGYR